MIKCTIQDCDNESYGKTGFCNKHYLQMRRYGKIFKKTKFDPNNFIIENNVCKVECYDKQGNITGYGIIDIHNIDRCKKVKWSIGNHGYIRNNTLKILLHNFIMGFKGIDHINRNKLDCREENLRAANHSENKWNKDKKINNTSGFKGVSWSKTYNKWNAQIAKNYRHYNLGYFTNIIEAAKAYNKKAIELHGSFAKLNDIPGKI